ncbi:MAG: DUF2922 domain-containing protein [Terrisporobacter sp.]|uniref:DUF2922 domain-containing protein n=1 Tax=Terrisporobacter sp. TaxID=1965305 RepID=UPI002A91B1AE|nr:DUF2922 domain-containing protein [Terrisporobacter sp.]MDY6153545.1 DUF2922 domain-containing protein [Terrisporobacter sp.]
METRVLYMTFKNSLGNSCTITVEDPKADITEQNIIDAMNLIKTKNIFQPKGYDITTTVSAKIVDANTTEYNLIV